MKLIEIYVHARKKHPSSGYPAAKHQKHSKFAITDIREKPVNFFYCSTRALTLASATILLTQVSVPVHIYNSLLQNRCQSHIDCKPWNQGHSIHRIDPHKSCHWLYTIASNNSIASSSCISKSMLFISLVIAFSWRANESLTTIIMLLRCDIDFKTFNTHPKTVK